MELKIMDTYMSKQRLQQNRFIYLFEYNDYVLQGPDIEVDPTTLDFGLIEYGKTIEQIIKIKNLSPIIAKCQVKEMKEVNKTSASCDSTQIFFYLGRIQVSIISTEWR